MFLSNCTNINSISVSRIISISAQICELFGVYFLNGERIEDFPGAIGDFAVSYDSEDHGAQFFGKILVLNLLTDKLQVFVGVSYFEITVRRSNVQKRRRHTLFYDEMPKTR